MGIQLGDEARLVQRCARQSRRAHATPYRSRTRSVSRTTKRDRPSRRPGKPTDNAFLESFNGKFRVESLNANW
jgi:hypothetical protein